MIVPQHANQPHCDRRQIVKALEALTEAGQTIEFRALGVVDAPGGKAHTISKFFSDTDALADAALALDGKAKGVYITLNPVQPGTVSSVGDKDIVRRRWLPIDFDVKRPTNTATTDEEHDAARQAAINTRDMLRGLGWPEPIEADSGNGAHLLYHIDLPAQDSRLVERALKALDYLCSNQEVGVDTVVANASRIWKLYGTVARKGEHTAERPHRMARLLHVPERLVVVTWEQLEQLAAYLPNQNDAVRGEKQGDGKALDIDVWLDEHDIEVERVNQQDGRTVYRLAECPWSEDHSDGVDGAAIIRYDSGALQFRCHHSHCQEKTWQDFRVLFEPDAYSKASARQRQHTQGRIYSARDLMKVEFKPTQWAVEGVLPEGTYLLAGKPKQGKSWMALGLGLSIASGGMALGKVAVDQGSVLYLALEDNPRRMQKRVRQILGDERAPDGLYITHDCPRSNEGGIALIEDWLEAHPDARLVIVDTLQKMRASARVGANIYGEDYAAVEPFQKLSSKHQVTILLITHLRKMAAEDDQDEITGSTAIAGAADGSLVLKRERGQDEATLTLRGRDVEEKSLALKFDGACGTWNLMGDAMAYQMTQQQRKVYDAIEDAGGKATARQVADLTGDDYNNIRQTLYQMSVRGLLSVESRGMYVIPNNPNNHNKANIPNNPNNQRNQAAKPTNVSVVRSGDESDLTIEQSTSPEIKAGDANLDAIVSNVRIVSPVMHNHPTQRAKCYGCNSSLANQARYSGADGQPRCWKCFEQYKQETLIPWLAQQVPQHRDESASNFRSRVAYAAWRIGAGVAVEDAVNDAKPGVRYRPADDRLSDDSDLPF